MKIYVLGSCSGTEPIENRHHTSLAAEVNGRIYFFDAGENCSYTAHLMDIDLLCVSDIFISHPHMDHVGGLGNLLWNIRKMSRVKKLLPRFGDVNVHISSKITFDSVIAILENSENTYSKDYKTIFRKIEEKEIYKDENITIQAIHNNHIPETENGWMSYSFLITVEGKKIVYSGDIKTLNDIYPFIEQGCDALFVETGHHLPEDLCKEIIEKEYDIKKIYFMHHGRAILYDYEGELEKCRKIIPNVTFCNDKDCFEI